MLAAGGVLVALALPALGCTRPCLEPPTYRTAAARAPETYNRIQEAFPGGPTPALVVVEAAGLVSREELRRTLDGRWHV